MFWRPNIRVLPNDDCTYGVHVVLPGEKKKTTCTCTSEVPVFAKQPILNISLTIFLRVNNTESQKIEDPQTELLDIHVVMRTLISFPWFEGIHLYTSGRPSDLFLIR